MTYILDYEPGKCIPHGKFRMEWKGEGKSTGGTTDATVTGILEELTIKLLVSGLLIFFTWLCTL